MGSGRDTAGGGPMKELFNEQIEHLGESHYLVLYWATQAEDRKTKYNITNSFDDLKSAAMTRTKQSAVAVVDALAALRFVTVKDEGNRRNLYITPYGARALERLVLLNRFQPRKSVFLEGT